MSKKTLVLKIEGLGKGQGRFSKSGPARQQVGDRGRRRKKRGLLGVVPRLVMRLRTRLATRVGARVGTRLARRWSGCRD
jgi:hypothetical protein